MALVRRAELLIDVKGPGEGQRDSWSGQWKVGQVDRGGVRFEASPGTSGTVFYMALADLRELVDALSKEDSRA